MRLLNEVKRSMLELGIVLLIVPPLDDQAQQRRHFEEGLYLRKHDGLKSIEVVV